MQPAPRFRRLSSPAPTLQAWDEVKLPRGAETPPGEPGRHPATLLLTLGLVVFVVAGLSIADMFVPRPYDGVVPREDAAERVVVREVLRGSGADRAGITAGDQIVGIGREILRDAGHAARVLNRFRIQEDVVYLVKKPHGMVEMRVRLGRRQIGDGFYLYATGLGFSFFFIGLFVLLRQPGKRVSQVFFLLGCLFLLFLVCRMRPPSYSGIDALILAIGTIAFLFLAPAFLHFYLLFPRPAWLRTLARHRSWRAAIRLWQRAWPVIYLLPIGVYLAAFAAAEIGGFPLRLLSGSPVASWWLLALYMGLGLAALGANWRTLRQPRERRGMALVLLGSLFGLVPFLVATLAFATLQQSRSFFLLGIVPLALVPITFTYAIVRFQLLDIRVILRRSLLYTLTTAAVTMLFAGGIASFNAFFRDSRLAASGYFPILLALAIVLLFEPLRRRLQEPVDRFFFAHRTRLQRAMVEVGEALMAQVDPQTVVEELVDRLPRLLDLHFAALYLLRGKELRRMAGPTHLPAALPLLPELQSFLERRASLLRLDQLGGVARRSVRLAALIETLDKAGVEAVGNLASRRRYIGLVLLSGKQGQISFEAEELELLQGLLHQASLALETSLLLSERTQQAELEREMEIAATIQARLLPDELHFAPGWEVAAVCRPARIVGGDFFTQLPAPETEHAAVVFGDVSGKSVSGALMMMAAHEALHALAMTRLQPGELFELANRRVYAIGRRSFVALGYFAVGNGGDTLRYLVAGQPPPLRRRGDGRVDELPLPEHRIPIGALPTGDYQALEVAVGPGEMVLGYSDGVTDALDPDGEAFGNERLSAAFAAASGSPAEIVHQVLAAVHAFARGAMQYDDLTLVAVLRRPESVP